MRSISCRLVTIASIAALLAFPTQGAAGPLLPDDLSTDQTWGFNTRQSDLSNIPPDPGSVTAPGPPITHLDATGATLEFLDGVLIVDRGKDIKFTISDFNRKDIGKNIIIDIIFKLDNDRIVPPRDVKVDGFDFIARTLDYSPAPREGFTRLHAHWESPTCPNSETVTISNPGSNPFAPQLRLDAVRIQTLCVPEPPGLMLLGLGIAGTLSYVGWRRRRFAA